MQEQQQKQRRRTRLEPDARRGAILAGALEAFAAKGFAATNREIAEAAGVASPALLYHYFPGKEDLLWAVVEAYAPPLQLLHHADDLMALPPRAALARLADAYLEFFDTPQRLALMKVVLGEALRRPEMAARFAQAAPMRMLAFLARYFARQMDAGALRRGDPEWAARAFVGPLLTVALTRVLTGDAPGERATMVENAVETFLRGMEGAPAEP